ncbi:unnamed protein product [Plutella xylostella]|uniref:(diamondback moth) hypothetical protein n=1 Tax=Plutella xylostella TaxID=51655 RepID=A0A8S4F8W9_PLUXY|nr:unnamed protein product [Plutella xylostella]
MNFEVDRYSSAWAHIALCADLTWAREPPDEFLIANQRLWAQHCRVSQVLQESATECLSSSPNNRCEHTEKTQNSHQIQENGSTIGRRSVKEVIPESRLAQFYGNFYYDDVREKCYINENDINYPRGHNGQGCENSDLTECWMLPEVDYWFRKLLDDAPDRTPRRRRQFRALADDDFVPRGPARSAEEAALAARVRSVRGLWQRAPSPPPPPRKMRARRRQPRRVAATTLTYSLDAPAPLLCDPSRKFQFEPLRPPAREGARARPPASSQRAARSQPYRGTNVTRYAPTAQRPHRCPDKRYGVWWPRDHPSPRLESRFKLAPPADNTTKTEEQPTSSTPEEAPPQEPTKEEATVEPQEPKAEAEVQPEKEAKEEAESPKTPPETPIPADPQTPTSTASEPGRKKRLYSTVLSMSAPAPLNLAQVRLSQKLAPGLLKLNPKIVLPAARIRPAVDHKFEELEKEALEQYKASDESIDTKFRELEKEAVEQYSTSNSNTSCSSGNSGEKKTTTPPPTVPESEPPTPSSTKQSPAKFHKEKRDSVTVYSQNFPDRPAKEKATSVKNLKNLHTPQRGEKKEGRRPKNLRSVKSEPQRVASDTNQEGKARGNHKGRWSLPPKKRHLNMCVSDCSSDEDVKVKDAVARSKQSPGGKAKLSAHGGGDLHPIMRKT